MAFILQQLNCKLFQSVKKNLWLARKLDCDCGFIMRGKTVTPGERPPVQPGDKIPPLLADGCDQ